MSLTKNQITVIHVAKTRLALDDDTYRDALRAYGGVRSSVQLDYEGFRAVMAHFERCGFKRPGAEGRGRKSEDRRRKTEDSGREPGGSAQAGMASEKQIKKIYAMWWSLGESYYEKGCERRALRGFLKKRFRVDHENFLRWDKAGKVIEAIKAIQGRTGGAAQQKQDGTTKRLPVQPKTVK